MKLAFPLMILLAVITVVGSYFQLMFVPYLVSTSVICIIVLIFLKKIPEKTYPVYIVGLALSMIWQQTMLGSYIVGTDIHGEYFIANKTITQGWDWSYYHLNITSIVINVFTPLLYKIGISVVWQFKLIYPIVLAFVPFILYLAFSKQFGKRIGIYSAIFFMIVPVFTVEIAGIVKSIVAEIFFASAVLVLFSKVGYLKKTLLLVLFGVLTVMSHYTVGTMVVAYLGVMSGILIIYGIVARKLNFVPVFCAVIIIIVLGALWLQNTGGGIVYTGYIHSFEGVQTHSSEIINNGGEVETSNKSYLYGQDSLVKTALGLDWNEVSISGKVFRVIQYITQLAIILGFILLVFRYKKFKVSIEVIAGIISCAVILGIVLFVPKVANIINTTRWYHFALFFASPLLVIGLLHVGKEKLLVGVLVAYYIFTCGLVFTLTHSEIPKSTIEIPYSLAYSANKGIVGIFNQDDIDCAKWILSNRGKLEVYSSYPSLYLPLGYEDWFDQFKEIEPKKPYLLFLSTQDVNLGKMITGTDPGMRGFKLLPDTKNMKEVYRQGKAVVYLEQ